MKKPIPTTPRTAISNLAVAARMFVPVIVNDNGAKWTGDPSAAPAGYTWNGKFEPRTDLKPGQKAPTFDELINLAGNAVMELKSFIDSHEALKRILTQTQAAFSSIEAIVLGASEKETLQPLKTTEEVSRIVNEHRQMKDVLEKAASSSPAQALTTAQAWVFPNGTRPTIVQFPNGQHPREN